MSICISECISRNDGEVNNYSKVDILVAVMGQKKRKVRTKSRRRWRLDGNDINS